MCGIVGLFSKSSHVGEHLGEHVARMLTELGDRGPDSAGVAVYRDPAPPGTSKLTLAARNEVPVDWAAVERSLDGALGVERVDVIGPRHALFVVQGEPEEAERWAKQRLAEVRAMSAGRMIEIYKEAMPPGDFAAHIGLDAFRGSHAVGHTRMATESRVTTEGSHPFSTGRDLCLVHNGSLSNHNRLRTNLRRLGVEFRTDNDTEVAAGYLTWRLREGASLVEALEGCLEDLDGFYTFAVGTEDGFAVLRDPIACKPAVMAENDDWVAMASEYRALAALPGAADAHLWEPEPGRVYSWGRVPV